MIFVKVFPKAEISGLYWSSECAYLKYLSEWREKKCKDLLEAANIPWPSDTGLIV